MAKTLRKLCASRWGRCLVGAIFAALLLLLIRAGYTVTFLTNDDTNILHTLAGDFTGTPEVSHPFINLLLGGVVSVCYSVMPGISWWLLFHLGALFFSLTAITACLIKGFLNRKLPLWMPFAAAFSLSAIQYAYCVIQMAFTLTSSMLGSAALAMILTYGMDRRDITRPFWAIAAILFFAAGAIAFRNSSGIALFPFWALGILYRILTVHKDMPSLFRKRARVLTALLGVLILVVGLGVTGVHSWSLAYINGEEFVAFDAARSRFMDYPRDTYEENPTLYEAVGWDETLYDLAVARFFMDERINTETLNYIGENSSFQQQSFGERVACGLRLGMETVRGNGQILYCLVPMLLTLLIAGLGFFRRWDRTHLVPFAACCLFALGGFFLTLYLCYTGRFPLRTFFLLAYPTQIGLIFTCLPLVEGRCALGAHLTRKRRFINLGLTGLVVLSLFWSVFSTKGALDTVKPGRTLRTSRTLYQYVLDHPTNVYFRHPLIGYDIDPYITYATKKPSNLIEWGGTGMHSAYQKKQLFINGIDSLTPDVFRRSDVYLVMLHEGDPLFESYMQNEYGALYLEEVEVISSTLSVYRVIFPE
ncbi:MAG: hypothetical protein IJF41_02300 [Clostridia bacterium]|nr:hypothetical protein [Clostridia bacterium]